MSCQRYALTNTPEVSRPARHRIPQLDLPWKELIMPNDLDALESALDDVDFGEFEEAFARPTIRTPSGRSSFAPRTPPAAASQGQVQAAARSLDSKIETLSTAVKALETRINATSTQAERTSKGLGQEVAQRKRADEAIRGDLQQTRLLSVLLPMLTNSTIPAVDSNGVTQNVVTQPSGGINSILPLLLILPGMSGSGDGSKGPLGGDLLTTLLLFKVIGK